MQLASTPGDAAFLGLTLKFEVFFFLIRGELERSGTSVKIFDTEGV